MARRIHELTADRDDRGSLVMAMLLVMVGTMLAALLVPVIVTQSTVSRTDARRGHAFDAAQTGVDVTLGLIRDARDSSNAGDLTQLPCTTTTPITGRVAAGSNERYQARVYYFTADPHGHNDWVDDPSTQIPCAAVKGKGAAKVPNYAVIVSTGSDDVNGSFASGTRTIQAIYDVRTSNTNVPGGLIHADRTTYPLCLDAGSANPTVGTALRFKACDAGNPAQTWGYLTNLTLNLVSTADPASNNLGLCVDTNSHTKGQPLIVNNCSATTQTRQQWVFGGYGNNWHAVTTDSKRDDSYCWNLQTPSSTTSTVQLGDCTPTQQTYEAARSFIQDAAVGGGAATAANGFIMNYNQFGRCLNVHWVAGNHPHLDPSDSNYDYFLKSYPCASVPAGDTDHQPLSELWKFTVPTDGPQGVTTQIQSTTKLDNNGNLAGSNGIAYCVGIDSPTTQLAHPRTDKCSKFSDAQRNWTIYLDTGDYATSYQIRDSAGLCMQAADPDAPNPDMFESTSKIQVATCSSSTLQKWNAPPGIFATRVSDYHEK